MDLFPAENEEGLDVYDVHSSSFTPHLLTDDWDTMNYIGEIPDLGSQASYDQTRTLKEQHHIDPQLSDPRSFSHSRHISPFTIPTVLPKPEMDRQNFSHPNRGVSGNTLRPLPTPIMPRAQSYSSDKPVRSQSPHNSYSQPQSQLHLPQVVLEYEDPKPGVGAFQNLAFGDYGGFNPGASTQIPSSVPNSGTQTPYQNEILNAFANPAIPLRVLDKFFNPFSNELVATLNRELTSHALGYINNRLEDVQRTRYELGSRQRERSTSGFYCSPERRQSQRGPGQSMLDVYLPTESRDIERGRTPAISEQSRSGTTTPGRRTPNHRRTNIKQVYANKHHVYKPLPYPPPHWVAEPPGRPSTRFEYTEYGELLPQRRFDEQELTDFIQYHPGHQWVPPDQAQEKSSLIIRIQNTPADSKLRYPDRDYSSRCRFLNCPTKGGTIRTGEFRVCFDEQPGARFGLLTDPFHNAGYAHLYCMEKNFNFHKLCYDFRVEPDIRRLPEGGVNRMAINRDHQSMLQVIEEYTSRDPQTIRDAVHLDDDGWFKTTLTYALTLHHRQYLPKHAKLARNERKGFSINAHMGNLKKRAEFNSLSHRVKKTFLADLYKDPSVIDNIDTYVSTMKRGERGVEEDDEEDEEDEEEQAGRKRKRQRNA